MKSGEEEEGRNREKIEFFFIWEVKASVKNF